MHHQTGKYEAAESLENCALRFRKRALDVVKSTKVKEKTKKTQRRKRKKEKTERKKERKKKKMKKKDLA